MQFISSAKNCVDVLLWRVFSEVANGTYVDFSPVDTGHTSITETFYNLGWRGVNVDLHPEACLNEQRPQDTNLRISGAHELATVWHASVLQRNAVHFAHIACDSVVEALSNNDWQVRPWVFVIQLMPAEPEKISTGIWEEELTSNGYVFAYQDDSYRLFVAGERSELLAQLKHPPNIFDNFTLQLNHKHRVVGDSKGRPPDSCHALVSLQESLAYSRASELKLRRTLFLAQSQLRSAENELLKVRSSTSWRLTAPLRSLVSFIHKGVIDPMRTKRRELIESLAFSLHRSPVVARSVQRLFTRVPSVKRLVSRVAGLSLADPKQKPEQDSQPVIAYKEQGMPRLAQQVYADLQTAITHRKKG